MSSTRSRDTAALGVAGITTSITRTAGAIPWRILVFLIPPVVFILAGFFAPLPYDPRTPAPASILLPPSSTHILGTDGSGFDIFSRTIAAATDDLPLALAGSVLGMLIGTALGLVASGPGLVGQFVVRAMDAFQAFPLLILAITIVTLTGNNLASVIYAILLVNVPQFVRLVRSAVVTLRSRRFIEAATVIGASSFRIMRRHYLPNIAGVIAAQFSIATAHAIVVIAALTFLGVGVTPPTPSWGGMIQDGAREITTGHWWVVTFPGIAVLICVASFNLLADSISRHIEGP